MTGPPREVIFGCDDLGIKVHAGMTGPAQLTPHHHEGWQQVQRLMRMSFPQWQGAPGWEIAIPVIFDGLRERKSVEQACHHLEILSRPNRKYSPLRPPQMWFDSRGDVPQDFSRSPNKRWVIAGSGVEWGDYITYRYRQREDLGLKGVSGGHHGPDEPGGGPGLDRYRYVHRYHRIRQVCTIHLWEFLTEKIDIASLHNLHYTIKKGDTLKSISQRFYGTPDNWRKIARANKIRDPNHPKVGRTIVLP